MIALSRRFALAVFAGAAFAIAGADAFAQQVEVTEQAVLHDPDTPDGGNPKGDVTIVAFLDYNCPFCKKSTPDLERIVREDGRIRVVYKDWPVLAPSSPFGAQLALAAKYQGKYDAAHHALMKIPGFDIPKEQMLKAVREAGIDMQRLNQDIAAHGAEIDALINRNLAQADALGFDGTPVFLVGPYRASTLDFNGFKQIVAAVRAKRGK